MKNSVTALQKTKNRTALKSSNPIPQYMSKGIETSISKYLKQYKWT